MPNTEPKFCFFERVVVAAPEFSRVSLVGNEGNILGRTPADDGRWYYTIRIRETGVCWALYENEMVSTGMIDERDDFFSGDVAHVAVDELGRGSISSNE